MKKFSKKSILKIVGVGVLSLAWMYIALQVLLGALSFPAFGFLT